jgi:hypothetical protein
MKTEIKYALLSAALLVVWVMVEHFLGFNSTRMDIGEYTHSVTPLATLVLLFLGIREKRNRELNGQLTFWQGLRTAFWISFFYAILQALWFALYSNLINPEYTALTVQFKQKQLELSGKTPGQVEDELRITRMIFDGGIKQFVFFILATTATGTLVGAILTLFLKTKKTTRVGIE